MRPNSRLAAIISPDIRRQQTLVRAVTTIANVVVRSIARYPADDEVADFSRPGFEIIIVDLDTDVERALKVIEGMSLRCPGTTVTAYCASGNLSVVRRAMRAGASDLLTATNLSEALRGAFAAISRGGVHAERARGSVLVFAGSKRGVGVTCAATNLAVGLTKESRARVVIVDMDLHGGDVAFGLGLTATASVADALANPKRLDRELLSCILTRHGSGLSVLAAPEKNSFSTVAAEEGIPTLLQILREEFDYIVVDASNCRGRAQEKLFEMADEIYLVTELSFPALHNGRRLISHLNSKNLGKNLEVVLNRSNSKTSVNQAQASRALLHPIAWQIPNGKAAVRTAWEAGTLLSTQESVFMKALTQMARAVCGRVRRSRQESAPQLVPSEDLHYAASVRVVRGR